MQAQNTASPFIFEIYTEEIPAAYQQAAVENWQKNAEKLFVDNKIDAKGIRILATPRRLALFVSQLSEFQTSATEVLKGPPRSSCFDQQNQPTAALKGFAAKAKTTPDAIQFEKSEKGEYAIANVQTGGESSLQILPQILDTLIKGLKFPRTMRWSDGETLYARPILQYFAAYGNKTGLSMHGTGIFNFIQHSSELQGHFIFSPGGMNLPSAGEYEQQLQNIEIVVDPVTRKNRIVELLTKAAGNETLVLSDATLNEVIYLVERPGVVRCSFPEEFLRIPDIVIISEMEEHQRYFALRRADGSLSNEFLVVTNGNPHNKEAKLNIRSGNERVLKARLSDGAFFYDEDRKRTLISRLPDLKTIIFQEGLGTLYDKVERLKPLVKLLSRQVFDNQLEEEQLFRAVELMKADLTTQLVYEFDHLQGQIGRIYALADKEHPEVAAAIEEHYRPRFQGDSAPETQIGTVLSIAEKLDNLAAGYILGRQPTSSQDPFGLRRQALYLLEMIIAQGKYFSFPDVIRQSLQGFEKNTTEPIDIAFQSEQIWEFLKGRFVTVFEKEGFDKPLIKAGVYCGSDDVVDIFERMNAIREVRERGDAFSALMSAFRRMDNILETAKVSDDAKINDTLFLSDAEKNLFEMSQQLNKMIDIEKRNYGQIFQFLSEQRENVDQFFESVMVMHDDPKIKNNRIALLQATVLPVKKLLDLNYLK